MMRVIGITGGVGAGKTAILDFLKTEYHAVLLVADRIAQELMEPGTAVMEQIREIFPAEIFERNGSIIRPKMAEVIFKEPQKRQQMNQIVHPAVKQYIREEIARAEKNGEKIVVVEAALLIEDHYDEICDEIWYVYTTEENRTKRLMESRDYSLEKIRNIFDSQLTEEEFRKHSAKVIDNNHSLEETCRQIREALNEKGDK